MTIQAGMSAQECLRRIQQTLEAHDLFYGHGTDNARDEAGWLLDTLLNRIPGADADDINEARADAINEVLERRVKQRKPLAYLLNEAWFAGLPFYVDERVLVPRSPIAELIENRFQPLLRREPQRILDLCAGGGCIGIACAHAFPGSHVDLADISADALKVAAINVDEYELGERVRVIESDLFGRVEGTYDLIVSNPPYVSIEEHGQLPAEYQREPSLGLVSADGGLDIPREILRQAGSHLAPDGLLILEVGDNWEALQDSLPDMPFLWLEFEHGGHGVCALRADQLAQSPDGITG